MLKESGGNTASTERVLAPVASKIPDPEWGGVISDEEWIECERANRALHASGIDFLVGGAFGLAAYTGRLRDTKDLDFFVRPSDVATASDALSKAGFSDLYPAQPYDRGWIYRSTRDSFVVDIIFRMANRRADVDSIWFERGRDILLRGERLRVIPPEELLWQKLYVLQRDRCDWPDVLNLLHAVGQIMDWEHLISRMEGDLPLLRAVLEIFDWLCPGEAQRWPKDALAHVRMAKPARPGAEHEAAHRVRLLDSRAWFIPVMAPDQPLEI